jgi:hypothetical protein
MTSLSRSDRALLNAARRDLRDAPKVLGYGRADRCVERHSGPDTAEYACAAASASTLATTSGTTISQIRFMSGAENPAPALSRGRRNRNPHW